jgi:hypothetical protein
VDPRETVSDLTYNNDGPFSPMKLYPAVRLAPLADTRWETADSCLQSLNTLSIPSAQAFTGGRICVTTSAGRTAFLSITNASPDSVTFQATVWTRKSS